MWKTTRGTACGWSTRSCGTSHGGIWHDPYLVHPGGGPVNAGPVLDWIIAAAALVLGAGAPSPRLVDVVGAYVPPVLGSLTVVPVYVLGRELFSRRAGLWAALMVAVMPGQLLQRSLLGFTDHHCAEVLFSTTAMMFVVLATKNCPGLPRCRTFALASGLGLGAYLLTWGGGVLFVAILVAWALLQMLLDAVCNDESDDIVRIVVPTLSIGALMVAPWAGTRPAFAYQLGSLVGGAALICALQFSRRLAQRRRWRGAAWAAAAVGVACASAALAVIVMGDSAASLATDALRVSPFRPPGFIVEAQPLMASEQWRPVPLWKEFTSSLILAVAGGGLLLGRAMPRQRSPRIALLAWWTATMIFATFGQVRFAYYLAVNVALIGGFTCDRLLGAVGAVRTSSANRALATCVLACLVIVPGVPLLRPLHNASAALNDNWHDALTWLGTNTPEPFPNPDEVLSRRSRRFGGGRLRCTRAVGLRVLDYPGCTARACDEPTAGRCRGMPRRSCCHPMSSRRTGSSSVWGPATSPWTGSSRRRAPCRKPKEACFPLSCARPEATRWITAGCSRTRPLRRTRRGSPSCIAIRRLPQYGHAPVSVRRAGLPLLRVMWRCCRRRREVRDNLAINVVTGNWSFASYEEAARFVASSGQADAKIVSKHPLETCVPLEALTSYAPVFKSFERDGTDSSAPPVVQLFEYRPYGRPGD